MTRTWIALCLVGCGSAAPLPTARHAREAPVSIPSPPARTSLARTDVRRVIADGLGVFLQSVSLEDWPVMRDGKFYGFRLRSVPRDWRVDLQPGDVVLRVNTMPIERPEQADAAFRSIEQAKSLRVDLERDGKPRVLELPIVNTGPDAR